MTCVCGHEQSEHRAFGGLVAYAECKATDCGCRHFVSEKASGDLLAAEFALREILWDDDAASAVGLLKELGFRIRAPKVLAEAALRQESRG